ncbi:MAG: DUF1501 domain-containing protein [Planctomycetia bacterium]|nr:DUF1501 domain-containing protein [Planctomycetia bacterium]
MLDDRHALAATRRQFLEGAGLSIGGIALASLLADEGIVSNGLAAAPAIQGKSPLEPKPPHFAPKAKRVIFLFMAGGPSQLELFDNKPKLQELDGQVVPPEFTKGKRFAFIKGTAKLVGTRRKFAKHGQSGLELGETLPHLGSIADDVTLIRSMKTDVFNHGPAKLFLNTGSPQFSGRPSMGAWVTYGIGSESQDLPGFVVLQSGPRGPRGGSALYASGFLPTTYQGVPFLSGPEPILNLSNPPGVDRARQGDFFSAVRDLNGAHLDAVGDPEIATRIAAYEMAYRMQASAPDLMDLSDETEETMKMYGAVPGKTSFANNCLLARRMIERGTRFVQLYHSDWDHHGNPTTHLGEPLTNICKEVDQPAAALVRDLKQRGLLKDTLVVWSGEFGRTPMGEPRDLVGRDHHIDAYSCWLAGGGTKPGQTIGKTDEIGYNVVEDPVHVHDLQATILHLLGLDHLKLTYKFQGRNFRLTDVHGNVVKKLLA